MHVLVAVLGVMVGIAAGESTLKLRKLPSPGDAVCLDGSPPAYYFRFAPAGSPDAHKWKVHMRGGGWCFSEQSCLERSRTLLGSSNEYPLYIPDGSSAADDLPEGLMSDNTTANPNFAGWNSIFVEYCTGCSFTGNRDQPLSVNGTQLFFRGFKVLNAVLADLSSMGMASATDIVVTGTSAGGLATYIHAPHYQALFPNARVVAIPDAGFFLDHPDKDGVPSFRQSFQGAVGPNLWNSTSGLNPACVADNHGDSLWKCAFAPYTLPYIKDVPVFIVNSLYDSAQLSLILHLACAHNIATCTPEDMAMVTAYRQSFVETLSPILKPSAGAFLTACNQHEETCADFDWGGITIRDTVLAGAAFQWYSGAGGNMTYVDGTWPNNPTCPPNGSKNGGC